MLDLYIRLGSLLGFGRGLEDEYSGGFVHLCAVFFDQIVLPIL
jgi:hypothetical protein